MDGFRVLRPLLRCLDPETAHDLTLWALRAGLGPRLRGADDPILSIDLWGRRFANPVGLSAGFDKDARAVAPLFALGLGFLEVGSITPRPQPGNPRPRVFRLPEDQAVINRYGFNSRGSEAAARALELCRRQPLPGPLGINLGKNKDSAEAADDYVTGTRRLAPYADYLVINVSSPNTRGLSALQGPGELRDLLRAVRSTLASSPKPPPLVLKIAPDLTPEDLSDIAAVALELEIDGVIATNTTIARPESLEGRHRNETGGLSGQPLFEASTRVLSEVYRLTGGRIPLIGVGGIGSAAEAYRKIRAGASLVQLYTALVYQGPALITQIKRGLADHLHRDGFASLAEAVGADHR